LSIYLKAKSFSGLAFFMRFNIFIDRMALSWQKVRANTVVKIKGIIHFFLSSMPDRHLHFFLIKNEAKNQG
jgi:hypothetical protein